MMRVLLVAGALVSLTPVFAQIGGTGSIQGTVTDPSGAGVPGATVVATNAATGVKTSTQTTAAGVYNLSPLPPGVYNVTASATGFQTLRQDRIEVNALSTVGLNLHLILGTQTQQVTVTETPPALNTSDASLGQTMNNQTYAALPLQIGNAPRDPTAFTSLMPGVSSSSATGNTAGNVFASQDHSQDVYVEGLPATNPVAEGENRTLSLGISVEAVDQFQLETAGTPVMYQGQGAANFVIKSGTNQLHGSVYEYFRNTDLDARSFFAKARTAEHQNEFGFTIGGPVIKNKIFFFGNYDGFRFTQGAQPSFQTIPTVPERTGDFSAFPQTIYDPNTTSCGSGPCTRQPFPGNMIPSNRISPVSQYFQSFLPQPTNNNIQSNYLGTVPVGYTDNNTTDKFDFNLTDRHRFYVVFSRGHRGQTTSYRGQTLPLPYANTRLVDEVPTTAQTKYTYVATPNLVNQASFGFSRLWVPITNATIAGNYPIKAGLTGLPPGEAASSFPEISWAGPDPPDGWRGTNARAFTEAMNTFTAQDNVQWTHGKHAFTFGFQFEDLQANEKTDAYGSVATWNFSNSQTAGFNAAGTLLNTTGNAYASYLLGLVNSANVTEDYVVGTGGRYKDYSWWVQDNYRVTPRLTLNLGLRHDIWGPYQEVLNRMSFFNPLASNSAAGGHPGILEFAGSGPDSCNCSTPVDTDYLNFGPRVGAAFSITSNTVIRAGYSIMYTHRGAVGGRGGARTGTGTLGFSASPSFTSPDQGISPAFNWSNGVPAYRHPPFFDPTFGTDYNGSGNPPATLTYGDPSLGGMPPRYQNWNFSVEHSLHGNLTLGLAYIGSNGHFLGGGGRSIWSDQINPLYLPLGNLLQAQATPANIAAAGIPLPYPNFTGTISQALRPWPQYSGITDIWGDVGNSNYNALEVTVNRRLANGLTFSFNYSYSKAFDDTLSNMVTGQTSSGRTAYNWGPEKAETQNPGHILNLFGTYQLPFDNSRNPLVRRLAGGWQVGGIGTYRSGTPIGTIAAASNLPNAGTCYADYAAGFSGPVRINGGWGSGDLLGSTPTVYLNRAAFVSPQPFTYGNTPRTNVFAIQNPGTYDIDLNLNRTFKVWERVKLTVEGDAFNVFNLVTFSAPNTNITSSSFGRITGQSNGPRIVQFAARVTF